MLLGYERVSTDEQETHLQRDALKRAGVRHIYSEKRGRPAHRPELERLVEALRPGDTVVVWKLDRLAGSLGHLLRVLDQISDAGASLRSLTEPFDTSSAAGELLMHMLGVLSHFERRLIIERTRAGVRAAQERGVAFGRPRALTDAEARAAAKALRSGRATLTGLARLHGCHLSSIKRAIARVESGGA